MSASPEYQKLSLSQPLYGAQQVRQWEPIAAEKAKLSLYQLMENAGAAAFSWLKATYPKAKRILLLAGSGNNAGDGYVLARLANAAGYQVAFCAINGQKPLQGDAKKAQQRWQEAGGCLTDFAALELNDFDVIVDALLGTGVEREVRPDLADWITRINQVDTPVLSLDLPSGLHPDSGVVLGVAVKAHSTITFVAVKSGLVTGTGKEYCGKLVLANLGVSDEFYSLATKRALRLKLNTEQILPTRLQHSYKGSHGKILCIGGNQGMPGAIRLSAEAALRSGAGLVKVFCHAENLPVVMAGRPELMVQYRDLKAAIEWADVLVLGPGLGRDQWAQHCFGQVVAYQQQHPKPLVLDADGLTLLADTAPTPKLSHTLLTPHVGEAARLLKCDWLGVERDRYAAAAALFNRFAAPLVLKGAGSLVQTSAKNCWVCGHGNPGMASGGMGDVLSGVIAALVGQGLQAEQALLQGVILHSAAADAAAESGGQRGMIASDLFPWLRKLLNAQD